MEGKKPVVTSETVKGSSGRDRWVVKDAEETHTNYMALTTTCDITHPDQHKLSETKISTFSKGLQKNLVNPASAFFDDLC